MTFDEPAKESPKDPGPIALARQRTPRLGGREQDAVEKSDFRSAEARDFGRVVLEELFETMLVGPGVPVDKVAQMIIANVGTHNRLQLGFSLLQLLVASVGQHHSWRDVSSIVRRCTPDCKGPPEGRKFGRQRDLLPLPLPAFGAVHHVRGSPVLNGVFAGGEEWHTITGRIPYHTADHEPCPV